MRVIILILFITSGVYAQSNLKLNDKEYFETQGLDVMAFSDFYPDGHQSGVTIIQHGVRVCANGDLRLEPSPGQWSPIPKKGNRIVSENTIKTTLWYPDSSKNMKGFNPIKYPDLAFNYHVTVELDQGNSFKVIVDLDEPLPEEWVGKIGFNLELFPGEYFGKSYIMDDQSGIFNLQPNGPISNDSEPISVPLAEGSKLSIAPEHDTHRMIIASEKNSLQLIDGRSNHNNGWFIVRSPIPGGATKNAVIWKITPNVIPDWKYSPVLHHSQVGYHADQKKELVIELDKSDQLAGEVILYKLTADGKTKIESTKPKVWGEFLRYQYLIYDFSHISDEGMYIASYRNNKTNPFKISKQVYEKDVWQPTLEYFLPVQMCHMRVNEKYRVWHGLCHMDDALMAPIDTNHFDGYVQGNSTLTSYKPLEHVTGLNIGGWHDAGDYDLRVESQVGTLWKLALMVEEFGVDYDATLVDQDKNLVEIHMPDGKSDMLQQIEHGLLSVTGAYESLGRLYRGIICSDLRQYVMLGDGSTMTNNIINAGDSKPDDRLVFTEENPKRELFVAAGLAAASRVLAEYNPSLSTKSISTALAIWRASSPLCDDSAAKIIALSELIISTNDAELIEELVNLKEEIEKNIDQCGWAVGHVYPLIKNKKFRKAIDAAVGKYQEKVRLKAQETPFGIPYEPNIWGAGWTLQDFGVKQYFYHKAWPEIASREYLFNSLNFVLGTHPGINTSSFVSGVGAKSVTTAYGVNRADWSFIPGGSVSGTALIRPDLPELKDWPFFWQQAEYVMGGGATNFMFMVLATQAILNNQ